MATQRTQSCIPIAIEQILTCKQPQFRIYDIPVQIISLVCVIRDIAVVSTEVTLNLQDHTGSVKGVIRLETASEVAAKLAGIEEGKYSKIYGSVRNEDDAKVVLIVKMFPVDDLNVITNHLLQVTCFLLEAEAERNKQLASANTSGAALADSLEVDEGGERPRATLTDFQRLIFDIVRSEDSEIGIAKRNVLRQFPSYQGYDVNQALEHLINEGIVYYTVDQEHLKAAALY